MKKYIVYSGGVVSRNDGDVHYITAEQIMQLHHVNPQDCIIVRTKEDRLRLKGIDTSKMIRLFPRNDGNYKSYNKANATDPKEPGG